MGDSLTFYWGAINGSRFLVMERSRNNYQMHFWFWIFIMFFCLFHKMSSMSGVWIKTGIIYSNYKYFFLQWFAIIKIHLHQRQLFPIDISTYRYQYSTSLKPTMQYLMIYKDWLSIMCLHNVSMTSRNSLFSSSLER
jgi:hypothetical protein